MYRILGILGLLTILTACGGMPTESRPAGFVNLTIHSDAQLRAIWKAAQENLAHQIDLNPLQRRSDPSASSEIRPGDPRALTIEPHQVVITGERDVPSSDLYSVTGVQRADPTGLISCPQPCNVKYAAAYSKYKEAVTKYASSWDGQGQNFELILQYEFENQILFVLGYDTKWR